MRLDKYLKESRLIKRRAVANEACDSGRIKVNGKIAKAGHQISSQDLILIEFGFKLLTVEVKEDFDNPRRDRREPLYTVIEERRVSDE